MSLRINNNLAALGARNSLSKNEREVTKSLQRLASGSRIVRAGDDAAGFAIAERLKGQINSSKQARRNAESAMSLIQTAEGGLSEQNNILVRLRELAVHSASDTIGDEERGFIDKEFQQLSQEFGRLAKTTRFGSKSLLTGTGEEFSFQVGAFKGPENVISFRLDANTTSEEAGLIDLTVSNQDDALDALAELDAAVNKVAEVRATFGAAQSRFERVVDNLAIQTINLSEARSNISDVDVAEEVANLANKQVLSDMAVAVLAQANQLPRRALMLLGH